MNQLASLSNWERAWPLPKARQDEIIRQLRSILSGPALTRDCTVGGVPQTHDNSARAARIDDLLRTRARRARYFGEKLFADPAWDMLLELYSAELAQRRVSVTSLGYASGVPATTALRWMNTLERAGLIERQDDPLDGRRRYVTLSHQGLSAMNEFFSVVPAALELI